MPHCPADSHTCIEVTYRGMPADSFLRENNVHYIAITWAEYICTHGLQPIKILAACIYRVYIKAILYKPVAFHPLNKFILGLKSSNPPKTSIVPFPSTPRPSTHSQTAEKHQQHQPESDHAHKQQTHSPQHQSPADPRYYP